MRYVYMAEKQEENLYLDNIALKEKPKEFIALNDINTGGKYTYDVIRFLNREPNIDNIDVFKKDSGEYKKYPRTYGNELLDTNYNFQKEFFVDKENFEKIKEEIEKIKEEHELRADNMRKNMEAARTAKLLEKEATSKAEAEANDSWFSGVSNIFKKNKVAINSGGRKKTRKSKKQRKNKSKRSKR